MAESFYKEWFNRTTPPVKSEQEKWKDHTNYLCNLAMSQFGTALAERFDVPAVAEAEAEFEKTLMLIDDPDIRDAVDTAAGKISSAYQTLGFCAGHFSQDSRARMI